MQCLNCNSTKFSARYREFHVLINNRIVILCNECFECNNCLETVMDSEQMNEMFRDYRMESILGRKTLGK